MIDMGVFDAFTISSIVWACENRRHHQSSVVSRKAMQSRDIWSNHIAYNTVRKNEQNYVVLTGTLAEGGCPLRRLRNQLREHRGAWAHDNMCYIYVSICICARLQREMGDERRQDKTMRKRACILNIDIDTYIYTFIYLYIYIRHVMKWLFEIASVLPAKKTFRAASRYCFKRPSTPWGTSGPAQKEDRRHTCAHKHKGRSR